MFMIEVDNDQFTSFIYQLLDGWDELFGVIVCMHLFI